MYKGRSTKNTIATHRCKIGSVPVVDRWHQKRTCSEFATEWFCNAWLFLSGRNNGPKTIHPKLLWAIRYAFLMNFFGNYYGIHSLKSVVRILELSHPIRRVFYFRHKGFMNNIVIIMLIWRLLSCTLEKSRQGSGTANLWNSKRTTAQVCFMMFKSMLLPSVLQTRLHSIVHCCGVLNWSHWWIKFLSLRNNGSELCRRPLSRAFVYAEPVYF